MTRFFSMNQAGFNTQIQADCLEELSVKLGGVEISEAKVNTLWNTGEQVEIFVRKNKSFVHIGNIEDITQAVAATRKAHKGIQSAISSIKRKQECLMNLESNRSVRAVVRASSEMIERLTFKAAQMMQSHL